MRLGFFTACLPSLTLDEIVRWASADGFEALEIAAWPRVGARGFEASHLDVMHLDEKTIEATSALFEHHNLAMSAIGYYENNLHPDETHRTQIHQHLRLCIDAAHNLGVDCVGTFIGRDPTRPVHENLQMAERIMPRLVDYAGERGVRLVIENCPMEGWHPDGYPGNLAYSPELWEWMFDLGLYLNYDPSHLIWLGIDPVSALRPYVHRILHMQAKDVQIDLDARNRFGVFGRTVARADGWDTGWWRYRVPGLGDVDWRGVIDTLYELGYKGAVSIEHEDPVWGGDEHRVKQGLRIAFQALRPLVVQG